MTAEEIVLARELSGARFIPGSWEKRFCRDLVARAHIAPEKALSPKQARWLRILHHKFRRQIPHRCGIACRLEELPGSL